MAASRQTRLAFLADVWKLLVAPIMLLLVGLGVFVYEAIWGHAEGFAALGLTTALTGAGLGADFIEKRLR